MRPIWWLFSQSSLESLESLDSHDSPIILLLHFLYKPSKGLFFIYHLHVLMSFFGDAITACISRLFRLPTSSLFANLSRHIDWCLFLYIINIASSICGVLLITECGFLWFWSLLWRARGIGFYYLGSRYILRNFFFLSFPFSYQISIVSVHEYDIWVIWIFFFHLDLLGREHYVFDGFYSFPFLSFPFFFFDNEISLHWMNALYWHRPHFLCWWIKLWCFVWLTALAGNLKLSNGDKLIKPWKEPRNRISFFFIKANRLGSSSSLSIICSQKLELLFSDHRMIRMRLLCIQFDENSRQILRKKKKKKHELHSHSCTLSELHEMDVKSK